MRHRWAVGGPALFAAAILLAWQMSVWLGLVPNYLLPTPVEVAKAFYLLAVEEGLPGQYLLTLTRVLLGFGLGAGLGILFSALAALSEPFLRAVYPFSALAAATPAVALIPLLIIWLGVGEALPVAAVFLCSFAPIFYNVVSAARGVDPEVVSVARTLGAGRLKVFTTIILPQSLPAILSALKMEAAMAWRTAFVAEMLAMSSGIGYYMLVAQTSLRVDYLIALIAVLAVSSYGLQHLFEVLERRVLMRWGWLGGSRA